MSVVVNNVSLGFLGKRRHLAVMKLVYSHLSVYLSLHVCLHAMPLSACGNASLGRFRGASIRSSCAWCSHFSFCLCLSLSRAELLLRLRHPAVMSLATVETATNDLLFVFPLLVCLFFCAVSILPSQVTSAAGLRVWCLA